MYDPLGDLIGASDDLPVVVLAVNTETDTAHLIVADGPDDDVAVCGERAPFGAWHPSNGWPASLMCRDCLPRTRQGAL